MTEDHKKVSERDLKKVLILAYYFPPLGMGGTQRPAKFVKYLPEFNWTPFVITVKDIAYYAKDLSLLNDVRDAQVFRTGSLDPQRLLSFFASHNSNSPGHDKNWTSGSWQTFKKIVFSFFIPDTKIFWLPFAILKAIKVINRENITCVFTTSPPHSLQLAGLLLKKIKGLPWVVDFRDGWSNGNFQGEPTAIHKWLNRFWQRCVLAAADEVIGVSSPMFDDFKSRSSHISSKFHTIPNGFDPEDLPNIQPSFSNDKFTIVYCGTVSAISPMGSFLNGLSLLLSHRPDLRKGILFKFIGIDLTGTVKSLAGQLDLNDVIQYDGYLDHQKAFEGIVKADVLLYPVSNSASQDFVPGKTFEYLASRNPILAIGPRVAGTEILEKHSSVEWVSHEKIGAIEQAIFKCYSEFKNQSLNVRQNDISQFERKNQTRMLAEILDNLVSVAK